MATLTELSLCFYLFIKNSSHDNEMDFVSLFLSSGILDTRSSGCNKIAYTFPGVSN